MDYSATDTRGSLLTILPSSTCNKCLLPSRGKVFLKDMNDFAKVNEVYEKVRESAYSPFSSILLTLLLKFETHRPTFLYPP